MRDCLNRTCGFDRVLTAVAASFLTLSATSAMAQADQSRGSAAELAIEAAIPRPEPANVPPPTVNDFKMDKKTLAAAPAIETKPAPGASKTAEVTTTLAVRVAATISSRFGPAVAERLAATAVPIAGLVSGATVNMLFMQHYQRLAHGHFTIRRLERQYGAARIETLYRRMAALQLPH